MKRIVIKIGSQIILDDEEKEGSDLNNILSEIVLLRTKAIYLLLFLRALLR